MSEEAETIYRCQNSKDIHRTNVENNCLKSKVLSSKFHQQVLPAREYDQSSHQEDDREQDKQNVTSLSPASVVEHLCRLVKVNKELF